MIVFDDGLGRLGPLTDLRASFEVRTGMLTTAGRISAMRAETLAGYWVPERLGALVAERATVPVNRMPKAGPGAVLLLANGRWSIPERVQLRAGDVLVEEGSDEVVAAALHARDAEAFLVSGSLPAAVNRRVAGPRALYRYPWDILSRLDRAIPCDLAAVRLPDSQVPGEAAAVCGTYPVQIHPTARVYPHVVLDAEAGPITIHEGATVRPGAVVCGPCSVGREAVVVDQAFIRQNTVIGPVCKVGGEVGATVFQGYANKSHDGHLGDSWVGEWVNIGAGTTNSNLLNTYGEITMRLDPQGPMHRTGRQFVGAFIGDHAKLAINTRLMTGAVIGTGAMIATTAPPPALVRPFAWLTDRGQQTFRFDKFMTTAATMMARRDKVPGKAYVAALEELYKSAIGE